VIETAGQTPGAPGTLRPPRIAFMTTIGRNVGDEFIREGIRSFLDEAIGAYEPYYVDKHDLGTLRRPVLDEGELLADKFRDADVVIQSGAPVYWQLGRHCCYNESWSDELWYQRIFKLGPGKAILNLGAGACQAREDDLQPLLDDPTCVAFAKSAGLACRWTSVRDPLAGRFLSQIGVEHDLLPCPAFHAARRLEQEVPAARDWLAINLMKIGGHFELKPFDPQRWRAVIEELIPLLRARHRLLFVAHDKSEAEFQSAFAKPDERVFLSGDYRDYLSIYGRVKGIVANRVHGAVCVAGFGRPAVIIGNDSRIGIARPLNIPAKDVGEASADWIISQLDEQFARGEALVKERVALREKSARQYVEKIRAALAR
jgi:hypothetical protein